MKMLLRCWAKSIVMAAKRDDKSFVLTPVHIDCFSFSVVTLIKVIDHQGKGNVILFELTLLYQTVKINSHYTVYPPWTPPCSLGWAACRLL